ncbi:putative permease [Podospora australis]|uniref:Permease n=1 Tax=Podospora australis TaxID=1536484 RepID=A0AAN6WUZ5_9PEZI|nr:putative permease [Podospora australis]
MQEPEIFEQAVASTKEDHARGGLGSGGTTDENGTYRGTIYSNNLNGGDPPGEDGSTDDYHDFVIPEDRKLGTWSTAFLIINRVVGAGIFSTPSTIIRSTNSRVCYTERDLDSEDSVISDNCIRLFVYLEYGTALPRSGGEKVYLERVYQRPRYLATCIFAVQFILFAISTGGSISFSSYLLRAALGTSESENKENPLREDSPARGWADRGIAVAAITVVCLIHSFAPRWGIWMSNGLGAFKLVLLTLIVCTGFAALSGKTAMPRPDPSNFSSFDGPPWPIHNTTSGTSTEPRETASSAAAGYALALLQVLYSYGGWENANYVLTEVRDAPKTLRRAAPIAISVVTVLYVLANIAYFSAMSKDEISRSKVVVAAQFFRNVWGDGGFVNRVMPLFIALSSLGNVFAQSFAMPRVKQELAKEGVLPWSRFWSSDWPFNAPSGAIFLHWIITTVFILASQTQDLYTFVTNVFTYSSNWIKVFLGIGLVYLNFAPSERWAEQRTTFRSSPILTIFWIVSLLFVQSVMFIPNNILVSIPSYVVPALGTSLLAIGTVYWIIWAKVLPYFGYHIQHEIVQMPDGSERVKYKRVKPKRRKRPKQWQRPRRQSVW